MTSVLHSRNIRPRPESRSHVGNLNKSIEVACSCCPLRWLCSQGSESKGPDKERSRHGVRPLGALGLYSRPELLYGYVWCTHAANTIHVLWHFCSRASLLYYLLIQCIIAVSAELESTRNSQPSRFIPALYPGSSTIIYTRTGVLIFPLARSQPTIPTPT